MKSGVRSLLEDKERQMFQIVRLMDEQQSINKKIANQIPVIVQTKGTVLLVYLWHMYGAHTVCRPKVTMFAVEMWFGAGDGVECGRSTELCPLPLGVPRCVIHNKKNVGTKFW